MRYALNLAADGRILSACNVLSIGKYDGMPIASNLPDGDVTDYRYIDGKYVHDPLPDDPEPEPVATTEEVMDVLLGIGGEV